MGRFSAVGVAEHLHRNVLVAGSRPRSALKSAEGATRFEEVRASGNTFEAVGFEVREHGDWDGFMFSPCSWYAVFQKPVA